MEEKERFEADLNTTEKIQTDIMEELKKRQRADSVGESTSRVRLSVSLI